MNVAKLASIATVVFTGAWASLADHTEASEWGCEVLLCASSSDPSWRGVPACHPPMHRLISAMDRPGFSWPTCPEAGTGRPGYERYDECPEGWSVGYRNQDRGGGEPNLCVQVRNTCPAGFRSREDCQQIVSMPRPVRENPYYVDIRHDDGNATRHWFSLSW
uniref:Uncharacterized protein n=1 Tax=Chelativorans sp. (strain BNC1) TaxID=266779 RepID=Q11N40_CHESB